MPTASSARTNRVTLGANGQRITGCPEAIYQLQLYCEDKKDGYVARVGFNLHEEEGERIISISNIQGIPVGESLRRGVEEKCGVSPFNFLLGRLKQLASDTDVCIRGLRNPQCAEAAGLYNTCLKRAGIPIIS